MQHAPLVFKHACCACELFASPVQLQSYIGRLMDHLVMKLWEPSCHEVASHLKPVANALNRGPSYYPVGCLHGCSFLLSSFVPMIRLLSLMYMSEYQQRAHLGQGSWPIASGFNALHNLQPSPAHMPQITARISVQSAAQSSTSNRPHATNHLRDQRLEWCR